MRRRSVRSQRTLNMDLSDYEIINEPDMIEASKAAKLG